VTKSGDSGATTISTDPSVAATVFALGAVVFLAEVYRWSVQRWDDAYITFRYAQHLLDGLGLVWNVPGERVEGYTSLAQILVLAFGMKLGIDPWLGSLLVGLAAVMWTVVLMAALVRRQLGTIHPVVAAFLTLYLLDATTARHVTSGLETQLFVAMLCSAYVAAMSFVDAPRLSTSFALGGATLLAILTRPEGLLFGTILYGVLVFRARAIGREALPLLAMSWAFVTMFGIGYAIWKYWYFGYVLPNPFYVKSGRMGLSGLRPVALYLGHLTIWIGPALLALLLFAGRAGLRLALSESRRRLREPRIQAKVLLTMGPAMIALAYYVTIVHEVGGANRFSYPSYFSIILACTFVAALIVRSSGREARLTLSIIAVAYLSVPILLHGSWRLKPMPAGDLYEYHAKIARALEETGLQSRATVLCDAAGVIPYLSGFNHIDRIGLVDNALSGRHPMTPEQRERYLWSQGADVYIGYEPPASSQAERAASDPRMRSPYVASVLLKVKTGTIEDRIFVRDPDLLHFRMRELRDRWTWVGQIDWPGWQLWRLKSFVYVRKDSAYAGILESSLRRIVALAPDGVSLDAGEADR
jgi:hypothetical protein